MDLLDYVITKSAVLIADFAQNVKDAKICVLAALFDKGEEGVFADAISRLGYYDGADLGGITFYRPELASSSERFLTAIDKFEHRGDQERAVNWSVTNLFAAGRHDLIAPLVLKLGERKSAGPRLKRYAIQAAFSEGAKRGIQDIVKLYYGDAAIDTEGYVEGLHESWNDGEQIRFFQFLDGAS